MTRKSREFTTESGRTVTLSMYDDGYPVLNSGNDIVLSVTSVKDDGIHNCVNVYNGEGFGIDMYLKDKKTARQFMTTAQHWCDK